MAKNAAAVAFGGRTLLQLDDGIDALQPTIPHLTRLRPYRCLQRPAQLSRLPEYRG